MKSWSSHKALLRTYARRKPETTPLYRIVAHCREGFTRSWEEHFQHAYGSLRNEVPAALDAYLNCGILAHGCVRACCQNCNHSELIAFSCKQRCLCPSCDAKRAVVFAENLVERVLKPYPHQHVVFTVPKRVRPFFKFNRSLLQHIYTAAWESWKELILEQCSCGTPAAVSALHTAGDLLAFHPHIHGLFLAGALLPDRSFVPVAIAQAELQDRFARKVLAALRDEQLLTQDDVDNILSWPHSGFNVFIGDPIEPTDTKRLLFAARYLKKCPLSNERLRIVEQNGDTTVQYLSFKNGETTARSFTPLQFLAELSQHIPDTWEQTSRFLGAYSARTRGAAKDPTVVTVDYQLPEPVAKPSANWARLMKKVFELEPLLCPRCGGSMKMKAFITDHHEIKRLTANLNIPPQQAPPPLRFSWPIAA